MVSYLSTVVLSVRVRRELKEEAEKLNIDVRKVVEEALEKAIERAKREKLRKTLKNFSKSFGEMGVEELVRIIRECRESR